MVRTKKAPAEGATMSPLVSVIIPTFNRAGLLQRAIESVREQTYQNLEIIVVDDASTDDTMQVVANIKDNRIRYVRHTCNRGGSAARNTGIHEATGDYIAFLDDDDEWEPQKTEEQLRALEHFDVVLCTSNESGATVGECKAKSSIDLEDLRAGRFTAGGTGILMARSYVLRLLQFDESLPRCQDWDLFIRIGQRFPIGYLNRALVRYNEGGHGRISNAILNLSAQEIERRLVILEKHRNFFGPVWYRRHLASFLLYGLRHRTDKLRHLFYTIQRCGIAPVGRALMRRLYQKLVHVV